MSSSDAELLRVLRRSQAYGFLGPGDVADHLRHARAHKRAAAPVAGERWCDLGSGGGVPGLVIAADSADIAFTLVDRSIRRAEFLTEAVHELGLAHRVEVVACDAVHAAHDPHHRQRYDGIVARSFGPPSAVAECSAGLLRLGGRLVVSEPPHSDASRWPKAALRDLGLVVVSGIDANHDVVKSPIGNVDRSQDSEHVEPTPRFATLRLEYANSQQYPRPWKQIRKRPLF